MILGGFVALGGECSIPVLRKLEELSYFVDLDFSSRCEQRVALDHRLAPNQPFDGLSLEAGGDRCAYADGTRPFLVHHLATKPWQQPMPSTVFSRLVRYLTAADLAIQLLLRRSGDAR